MQRILLILLSFFLLSSCSISFGTTTVLLSYEDFGPPSMANEILGMDWWQWQVAGDSRPKKYDIQVVVYRNISLDMVKEKYPLKPDQLKDYRYVKYVEAVSYLDRHIEENVIESLTVTLTGTQEKIFSLLGAN